MLHIQYVTYFWPFLGELVYPLKSVKSYTHIFGLYKIGWMRQIAPAQKFYKLEQYGVTQFWDYFLHLIYFSPP